MSGQSLDFVLTLDYFYVLAAQGDRPQSLVILHPVFVGVPFTLNPVLCDSKEDVMAAWDKLIWMMYSTKTDQSGFFVVNGQVQRSLITPVAHKAAIEARWTEVLRDLYAYRVLSEANDTARSLISVSQVILATDA